jgi:hypothetical protein
LLHSSRRWSYTRIFSFRHRGVVPRYLGMGIRRDPWSSAGRRWMTMEATSRGVPPSVI